MGTFTKHNQPQQVSPAGNPLIFTGHYTAITEPGFKFVADVYVDGTKVIRLTKSPTEGNYQFFDVSKIVDNYLTFQFNPEIIKITPTYKYNLIAYEVKLGYYTTVDKYVLYYGNEMFALNASLNRKQFNSYDVNNIGMEFLNLGNFLTDYNNRNVSLTDWGTLSALNGQFEGDDYEYNYFIISVDGIEYQIENLFRNSSNLNFLRLDFPAYPMNINAVVADNTVTYEDLLFYNCNIVENGGGLVNIVFGPGENYEGIEVGDTINIINSLNYNGSASIVSIVGLGVFEIDKAWNGTTDAGDIQAPVRHQYEDIITENTTHYDVYTQLNKVPTSPPYRFNLIHDCSRFDIIEIAWLNTWGGFDFITFNMLNRTANNIERKEYTKVLGSLSTSTWGYNNADFETHNYHISNRQEFSYNSNWLNDMESDRVIEMLASPIVYMLIDGEWIPRVVTLEKILKQTINNDKLIQYEITTKETYKKISQRQ